MLYVVRVLALLYASISYAKGNCRSVNYNSITKHCLLGNGADDCTSGFMSEDRMDLILGNEGTLPYGHNYRVIFPEVVFTCNGTIQSWIFGALWIGVTESLQLQIWRPVNGNDEAYTLVESTTIITEENTTQLYHYHLSSPLSFQAGDILGIFQPYYLDSQLVLAYEYKEQEDYQLGYYYTSESPFSPFTYFNISGRSGTREFNMFVNVITGECYI